MGGLYGTLRAELEASRSASASCSARISLLDTEISRGGAPGAYSSRMARFLAGAGGWLASGWCAALGGFLSKCHCNSRGCDYILY